MALVANLNRDRKKRSRPYQVADFLIRWTRRAPQTTDQMRMAAMAMTAAFGGTFTSARKETPGGEPR